MGILSNISFGEYNSVAKFCLARAISYHNNRTGFNCNNFNYIARVGVYSLTSGYYANVTVWSFGDVSTINNFSDLANPNFTPPNVTATSIVNFRNVAVLNIYDSSATLEGLFAGTYFGSSYTNTFQQNVVENGAINLISGSYTGVLAGCYYYTNNITFLDRQYYDIFNANTVIGGIPILPGGNNGNQDDTTDNIDFSALPLSDVLDSGFLTAYSVTSSALNDVSQFLWSDDFLNSIKKLFSNPIDVILGLKVLPLTNAPLIAGGATEQSIKLGRIDTTINAVKLNKQFITLDLGQIEIAEFWGNAVDYEPYTRAQIFLPFVGYKDLSIDEIMSSALHLIAYIDLLTGSLLYQLKVANNRNLNSVIYEFQGNCAMDIPITANDTRGRTQALISLATSTALGVLSGGASATLLDASVKTINNASQFGDRYIHSGNLSDSFGFMSHKKPFIILSRPNMVQPSDYTKFYGLPSNINVELSTITGYSEIAEIRLTNINATEDELNEIEELLKNGVIF